MKRLIITFLRRIANRLDGIKNTKPKYVAYSLPYEFDESGEVIYNPITEEGPLEKVIKEADEKVGRENYSISYVFEKDVNYYFYAVA